MNFSIYLSIYLALVPCVILPKAHVGSLLNVGRTLVHVLYDEQSEAENRPLEMSFNGVKAANTTTPLADSKFWPAKGDVVAINKSEDVVIAEITRSVGLKNGIAYHMQEVIQLPGVGPVSLIQQITGTKLGSSMKIGISAPELSIETQLFDDSDWHTVTLDHKDQDGIVLGQWTIDFCRYYFGSFFSRNLKHKNSPLWERLGKIRRTIWNMQLLSMVAGAIDTSFKLPTPQSKATAIESEAKLFENIETHIKKAYTTLGLDPEEAINVETAKKTYYKLSLKTHPDKAHGSDSDAEQQDLNDAKKILLDTKGDIDEYRQAEWAKLFSNDVMQAIRTTIAQDPLLNAQDVTDAEVRKYYVDTMFPKAMAQVPEMHREHNATLASHYVGVGIGLGIVAAIAYVLSSKPTFYPDVIYRVTYKKAA